jgi:hypothetical protein
VFLLCSLHKTYLFVTDNLSLHSKELASSQYIEDGTENWPSDDEVSIVEEMTQVQDLQFHYPLQKSKFYKFRYV